MTRSSRRNWLILLSVGLSTALASTIYIDTGGRSDEAFLPALRLTARASFMLYLIVFVARPLRQMFTDPAFTWLLRQRRSFGVAMAATHSVHLGLIAWRFSTVPGLEYGTPEAIIGGTAYLLMYLMLITSFDGPARALGSKRWRYLHKTGLYFIGAIFLVTLLPDTGDQLFTLERAWFVTLTVLALVIRLTAYFAQRRRG